MGILDFFKTNPVLTPQVTKKEIIMKDYEGFDYLTFTDRASYIIWRMDWRVYYKNLTADIRKTKMEYKEAQRNDTLSYALIGKLSKLKQDARSAIEARKESKQRASENYESTKEMV